jgi:RimJ/RimL family protein N-acetyltransferase
MTELETRRMRLRCWVEDDLDALATILSDPEVMRYIDDGSPCSREGAARWLEKIRLRWEMDGFDVWAAVLKETGGLVGWIGLAVSDELSERTPTTEVGWLLDRRYRGRGLATEGGAASLTHAFGTLGLDRVVSLCHPSNTASMRVMHALGMRPEPDAVDPRRGSRLVVYAMTAEDWRGQEGVSNP